MVLKESAGDETSFPSSEFNRVVFHCKLVFYRLDYGHLTYSSVQFFLFIDLFVVPVTISKLTATKYIFQKDYTWLNKLHRMFQN